MKQEGLAIQTFHTKQVIITHIEEQHRVRRTNIPSTYPQIEYVTAESEFRSSKV